MTRIKKVVRSKHEGKIILGDGIVEGIVNIAVTEIPHVELYSVGANGKYNKKTIKVLFDKEGVHVDVVVKVNYNQSVSDMAFKIQEVIRHNVEAMTDYHIASVNVIVKGVIFDIDNGTELQAPNKEELPAKSKDGQDDLKKLPEKDKN